MRARALLALPLILAAAAITPRASAADAGVAALQVGLRSHGLYQGPIDGLTGPGTAKAIRRLQKRAHITVDGVVGPQTRKALGRFASHRLGTRKLEIGKKGWDVASLQFRLAENGFPSGPFDGIFGPHIDAALRRFQDWSALKADGVAGPATLNALAAPPPTIPLPLAWPLTAPVLGDRFGPRGDRWHSGLDFPPLGPAGSPGPAGATVVGGSSSSSHMDTASAPCMHIFHASTYASASGSDKEFVSD
jgi:peptidoglycan hydrolase-like protein with peptidoglycan-binding domain